MSRIVMFAVALALVVTDATAQTWPARPVRLIVAGAAGSAPDIIARLIADRLTQAWGQQVIVDNRPGAAGNLGTAAAARAAPDGYTFLFGQAAPLAMTRWSGCTPGCGAQWSRNDFAQAAAFLSAMPRTSCRRRAASA